MLAGLSVRFHNSSGSPWKETGPSQTSLIFCTCLTSMVVSGVGLTLDIPSCQYKVFCRALGEDAEEEMAPPTASPSDISDRIPTSPLA